MCRGIGGAGFVDRPIVEVMPWLPAVVTLDTRFGGGGGGPGGGRITFDVEESEVDEAW